MESGSIADWFVIFYTLGGFAAAYVFNYIKDKILTSQSIKKQDDINQEQDDDITALTEELRDAQHTLNKQDTDLKLMKQEIEMLRNENSDFKKEISRLVAEWHKQNTEHQVLIEIIKRIEQHITEMRQS